ncbi:A/G-specific adenine glycosylase [Rhodopirellula sp. MGV]|uniref:A/G-specific adenine glycosylase n=1 Tax=Rhodopirellula sp. MGV TaxID=2023130 RepID=UPI000B97475A|nr:A/G-specific adenine glycosylase [Rhodopirellula sp. MGV]OYP36806.1 A/G-specific adenine glycosylase [Rhodopirellula sp. MGV]PNY36486.1 A/G-specific adenine glycosylase [Rhodopirellula baltica]
MTDSTARKHKPKSSRSKTVAKQSEPIEVPVDEIWTDSRWRSNLRRRLLAWFDDNARVLPWRSEPTPYRVWISEIMLQQTQVATVLPYYERWMKRYPTVASLANADEQDLMRLWEGLGYYRRVRSIHAAAKKIVEVHDGEFPTDAESVLALPGIGRYTAGAILSIACDQRMPILEGNTQRVFSRWAALRSSPTEKDSNKWLWQFAETMLPNSDCGTFNQAAMEIGALVCTPKNPNCDACPVMTLCRTAAAGLQQEIPGKIKRIQYEDRSEFALILSRQLGKTQQYLVRQLPNDARWAGLWDFPRPTDVQTATVEEASTWIGSQIGAAVRPGPRLKTIRHAVTKYRIQLHVHSAALDAPTPNPIASDQWQWVGQDQLAELPMSVTGRKIVDLIVKSDQPLLPLG